MADNGIDTDITNSHFFEQLSKDPLFDIAMENRLIVCIPLSTDCASAQFSSEFFQVHILRPDKSDEHVYFNMRNDKIMYENGCFSLKSSEDSEDQSKNFESAIVLMEETYVGNNDQSVRLLGLDCSLLTLKGGKSPISLSPNSKFVKSNQEIFRQCRATENQPTYLRFLSEYFNGVNEFLTVMEARLGAFRALLKDIWRSGSDINTGQNACRAELSMIKSIFLQMTEPINSNKKVDEYLDLVLEVLMFNSIGRTALGFISASLRSRECALNRRLLELQTNCSPNSLNIPTALYESLPNTRREIGTFNDAITPYGKLLKLKRIFALTTEASRNKRYLLTSDDLIPVLVYLVIKTRVYNWLANFEYIASFHFSCETDETQYCLASFEAALNYIESMSMNDENFATTENAENSGESADPLKEKWNQLISFVKRGEAENVGNFFREEQMNLRAATNGKMHLKLCHPLCRCDECRPKQMDISKYLTPESTTTGGRTILHIACRFNQPKILNVLLNCGLNLKINAKDDWNRTPLHLACQYGTANCVLLLLNANCDPTVADFQENTPLHLASEHGRMECVKSLFYNIPADFQHVFNINAVNSWGDTALHIATRLGFCEIVEFLLDCCAKVNVANLNGETPKQLSSGFDIEEIYEKHGMSQIGTGKAEKFDQSSVLNHKMPNGIVGIVDKTVEKFIKAVADNDLPMVKMHLETAAKSDLNENGTADSRCHPLCDCSKCQRLGGETGIGSEDFEKTINAPKLDINALNAEGLTALHSASMLGHLEIVDFLLRQNADPNVRTPKLKYNSLHFAAGKGFAEIVKILIENGSAVAARDIRGDTALHVAAAHGHLNCVELLIGAGSPLNAVNDHGNTAMNEAAEGNHVEVIRFLVDAAKKGIEENAGRKGGIEGNAGKEGIERNAENFSKQLNSSNG